MTSMYEYFDDLDEISKKRYKEKLALVGLQQCPYKFPADIWIDDPIEWPPVNYIQLFHYLIKTPRIYIPEAMEKFKSLDAWKFFSSGWVQGTLYYRQKNEDVFIFRSDVRPSFRTTDECHKSWIAIKSDGTVLAGHCNCMAGLGETCSHVGAMLYKIEAAVRLGLTSSTPTEQACQWNQTFVRNIKGCPVAGISIYSDEAKEKLNADSNTQTNATMEPTKEQKLDFPKAMHSVQPKCVGLSLFSEYSEEFICKEQLPDKLPQSLRALPITRE